MGIRFITVSFAPADGGAYAYFGWKLGIGNEQFGQVYQLPPSEALSEGEFRDWTTRALNDAYKQARKVAKDVVDG